MNDKINKRNHGIRIGAVARMTGLTTSTIRAWETRYSAITPLRSEAGYRLYSAETVERLKLLHALRLRGEPLQTLATMDNCELRDRLGQTPQLNVADPHGENVGGPINVAVVHKPLSESLHAAATSANQITVVADARDLGELRLSPPRKCDLLVIHLSGLGRDPIAGISELYTLVRPRMLVVEYDFARRDTLAHLQSQGARVMRGPVRAADVLTLAEELAKTNWRRLTPAEDHPDTIAETPRFSRSALMKLQDMAPSVQCECPHHLATILVQLGAFEAYSKACINQSPADAELHEMLARETGRARHIMETMLTQVCEVDGISLDDLE